MKNPCQLCERVHLDKDECSLGCERRQEYCKHLGIPVTGGATKSAPTPLIVVNDSQLQQSLCRIPKLQKAPKIKITCKHHPDIPALDRYRRLCSDCARERTEKKERIRAKSIEIINERVAREENRRPQKPIRVPRPPKPPYDWHTPRGMRSKDGCLEAATTLMKEGKGNLEICRLTGMSKTTAAKLRGGLEKQNGGPFLCECGKPATHPGWCSYRFAKSQRRQELIRQIAARKDNHRSSVLRSGPTIQTALR